MHPRENPIAPVDTKHVNEQAADAMTTCIPIDELLLSLFDNRLLESDARRRGDLTGRVPWAVVPQARLPVKENGLTLRWTSRHLGLNLLTEEYVLLKDYAHLVVRKRVTGYLR